MSNMSTLIHIRSKDCKELVANFNTNLQVDLSAYVSRSAQERIHLSLSSAEIPVSWYAFSTNLLTNEIYVNGVPSIVLVEGNYNIYELVALISAGPSPFDLSFNLNTSRCTFTNTTIASHTLNFSNAVSRGLAKALGFERIDVLVSGLNSVVGQSVVNLQTIHSLFLYSNLNVSNVITTGSGNYESILDKIPVLVGPRDIIHFNPYQTAPFSSVLSENTLKSFQLSIRDQNGTLVQLNGARYELSLLVEVMPAAMEPDSNKRRRDDIYQTPQAPTYQAPTYQAPTYQAPTYQAPQAPQAPYQAPYQAPQAPQAPAPMVPAPMGPPARLPSRMPYMSVPIMAPAQMPPTSDLSAALMMAKVLDLKR